MKTKKILLICCPIFFIGSLFIIIPSCKKTVIPTINTIDVSEVSSVSAVCGGDIVNDGNGDITERGVCWSSMGVPTISDSKTSDGAGTGNFTSTITNLTPGTPYQVRAYAINDAGVAYGNVKSFVTTLTPTVSTKPVTEISRNTAKCGGSASTTTELPISRKGVCWSLSTFPTIANSHTSDGSGAGDFISELEGLQPEKTYYVRAYATNAAGTGYGETVSFTTEQGVLPTLTTKNITQLTVSSVTSGGNITDNGGSTISASGVIWSTSSSFNINDALGNSHNIYVNNDFTCNITGLSVNVTYYVKAYATNATGTAYGNQITFLITPELPALTTSSITEIHANSAVCGGSISSDGGLNITAKGVCWSTSPSPTIENPHTSDGTGNNSFVSNISELTMNTTYYVRAYATNSVGTAYGNQQTFIAQVAIGDSYGGGIVAYILQPGDFGYDASVPHGIIAAPTDQSASSAWGCNGTSIPGTSYDIGKGQSNTNIILSHGCSSALNAANRCDNLSIGGYSDWYLPSQGDLGKLYAAKDVIGNFESYSYWSSTTSNMSPYEKAIIVHMGWGTSGIFERTLLEHVRCVKSY